MPEDTELEAFEKEFVDDIRVLKRYSFGSSTSTLSTPFRAQPITLKLQETVEEPYRSRR